VHSSLPWSAAFAGAVPSVRAHPRKTRPAARQVRVTAACHHGRVRCSVRTEDTSNAAHAATTASEDAK
jgi:hypothetical protein